MPDSRHLRVRLLYQQESPRVFARAIAPTTVLANRGYSVVAQAQAVLDTRTTYSITMLVDWRPSASPLPPHYGRVLWDVPEDIEDHLTDPDYQRYFAQVSVVSVPNKHLYEVVHGIAKQTVVLPTYLANMALWQGKQPRREQAIALFGYGDVHQLIPVIQGYLTESRSVLVTDRVEVGALFHPSITIEQSYYAYTQALKAVQGVLCVTSPHVAGDGFWARDALAIGTPVLTTPEYPAETSGAVILTSPEQWATALRNLDTLRHTQLATITQQKRNLVLSWGIQQHIQNWQRVWEKLAY